MRTSVTSCNHSSTVRKMLNTVGFLDDTSPNATEQDSIVEETLSQPGAAEYRPRANTGSSVRSQSPARSVTSTSLENRLELPTGAT